MRFDDRLHTVLNHSAEGQHARAVRWRQLVELLARGGSLEGSALAAQALDLLQSETRFVDEELRAAAARAVAALPLPLPLILLFARDSLKVSAPVLAAAQLRSDQWKEVKAAASEEATKFIETLQPGLDEPAGGAGSPPGLAPVRIDASPAPSIKEVIDRIDALRATRGEFAQTPVDARVPELASPPVPPSPAESEEPGVFKWECGPSGELEWVQGAPRASLIGHRLVEPGHDRGSGNLEIARAFTLRAPFSNAVVTLAQEAPLAGEWELSGMPAFDHVSGRFAGYRGIAKRNRTVAKPVQPQPVPHPDTLRELVHEIKTPLNAIMGFAEIIQGQMFGPAGTSYRSRAAEIVAQSNLLLMAIDDLDLAAKLQAGAMNDGGETDLAAVLGQAVPKLEQLADQSGVKLRVLVEPNLPRSAMSPAVVDRLLQRLIGGLIECCAPGELLGLTASQWKDMSALAVDRPSALNGLAEEILLDPNFALPRQRNTRLSLGFSLRLVRGIAQLAGGELMIGQRRITLLLGRGDLHPPVSDRYRRSAGAGPVAQR